MRVDSEFRMMAYVDAHCHVDLYTPPKRIIEQAESNHIYTIAVTNAPSVFAHTEALTAGSKYVRPAIGLHPELVHSHRHELSLFEEYLPRTRYIGEVGLDYSTKDAEDKSAQRLVLSRIASWVNDFGDKVLTVHSRRASADVISMLAGIRAKVILHWFSGTNKDLTRAIDCGFYFSVNDAMLQSKAGRLLINQMPKDRFLTETDGPFTRDAGVPATPKTVENTVLKLAGLWSCSPQVARIAILENFKLLLSTDSR